MRSRGRAPETLRTPSELPDMVSQLSPDAVLLDMNFAPGVQTGREGLDWLARIHALDPTVLERREVTPVGATRPVPVDVRLVTATNRPLADLENEAVLRQDLLFRIKTVEIILPPLRERREDIPVLLEHFLAMYARKYNVPRRRLSPEALALLESYAWPGNVRELRHAVERATILAGSDHLLPEDFPFASSARAAVSADDLDLERIEKQAIERALARFRGNVSQAAAALGLTRPALYRRMVKHGL